MNTDLFFLKLGGSLITDKDSANSARIDIIKQAAKEIRQAREENPNFKLLIGHGSGSFGHYAAKTFGTRDGVSTDEQWQGFAQVWQAAHQLHTVVIMALQLEGLPVIGFAPSAAAIMREGKLVEWNVEPIRQALDHGLIPVVYGDVVIDQVRGGGILSTEEAFLYLGQEFAPSKVLLAASEPVFKDFPERKKIVAEINMGNLEDIRKTLSGGEGSDVTGGMLSKVEAALQMAARGGEGQGPEVWIFSGMRVGQVQNGLLGRPEGTLIST